MQTSTAVLELAVYFSALLSQGILMEATTAQANELERRVDLSIAIAGVEKRLANKSFVDKAPAAIIEGAKANLADYTAQLVRVREQLAALGV